MWRLKILIVLFLVPVFSENAFAQCTIKAGATCNGGPCGGETRPERHVQFNEDHAVFQFCRDGVWRAFGPPPPPPIGHWKLDESSGTTATDSSGNGHHGTLVNAPVWEPSGGKIDGSLNFNGTTQRVTVADEPFNFGTGDFTVSFWMRSSHAAENNIWPAVVSKLASGNNNGYHIVLSALDDGDPYWVFHVADGTQASVWEEFDVRDGQWHHLVGVRKGDMLYAYRNGILRGSGPGRPGSVNTSLNLTLGGMPSYHACCRYTGSLDDVRIYNRALTAGEIAALFANASVE